MLGSLYLFRERAKNQRVEGLVQIEVHERDRADHVARDAERRQPVSKPITSATPPKNSTSAMKGPMKPGNGIPKGFPG